MENKSKKGKKGKFKKEAGSIWRKRQLKTDKAVKNISKNKSKLTSSNYLNNKKAFKNLQDHMAHNNRSKALSKGSKAVLGVINTASMNTKVELKELMQIWAKSRLYKKMLKELTNSNQLIKTELIIIRLSRFINHKVKR